jgi:phosphate uptake regulator
MQRRVIRQGNDTLTITLPKSWTEQFGIKPKDLLDVDVKNHILELSSKHVQRHDSLEFLIDSDNEKTIQWVLGSFFRIGVDELVIHFPNPSYFSTIQQIIRNKLIGFIIVKQSKSSCLIKSISTDDENSLTSLFQRNFMIVMSFAENIQELTANRDFQGLKDILYLHDNADQTISLCQRVIIKNTFNSAADSAYKISLLENLELLCDAYRDICNHVIDNKLHVRKKFLELLIEINNQFRETEQLLFDYNLQKCGHFVEMIAAKSKKIDVLIASSKKDELVFLFHLKQVLALIKNILPTATILSIDEYSQGQKKFYRDLKTKKISDELSNR